MTGSLGQKNAQGESNLIKYLSSWGGVGVPRVVDPPLRGLLATRVDKVAGTVWWNP